MSNHELLKQIPSVDKLLAAEQFNDLVNLYGHRQTTDGIRDMLGAVRSEILNGATRIPDETALAQRLADKLAIDAARPLTAVINLTGTVLHTNLGRAALPESAMNAVNRIATGGSNLEFDLNAGQRGDRDSHVESLIQELTGAEAVTVVNNNAAAVLLCLNTLAFGKEVCISRGELVEIGGSFRIPEVMEKSGCKLTEIGATNRTHPKDYAQAVNDNTGLLMKVHTSNYEIRGFTEEVSYAEVAQIAKEAQLPLLADLGSGTLVDLETYGLPHEPTVQEVLAAGTDVVTFSGDKLLGGPQAGIIAGRADLIAQIKQNPLKRALRVDKMTLAALTEVLHIYKHPESLVEALPTIKYLARSATEIRKLAEAVQPSFEATLTKSDIEIVETHSQIGSGALPLDQLPSCAIAIEPKSGKDADLKSIASSFRSLSIPVVGRMQDGKFLLDLRTLDSPEQLTNLLKELPGV